MLRLNGGGEHARGESMEPKADGQPLRPGLGAQHRRELGLQPFDRSMLGHVAIVAAAGWKNQSFLTAKTTDLSANPVHCSNHFRSRRSASSTDTGDLADRSISSTRARLAGLSTNRFLVPSPSMSKSRRLARLLSSNVPTMKKWTRYGSPVGGSVTECTHRNWTGSERLDPRQDRYPFDARIAAGRDRNLEQTLSRFEPEQVGRR